MVQEPARCVLRWRPSEKNNQKKVGMHGPLKLLGYAVVLAMAAAVLYAAYISITYWHGISV
jgi:hypothetical protein